jgi:prepilin peptidase CpaA
MPTFTPAELVLTAVLCGVTLIAAIWDIRFHKIPNKLTLPLFLAGLVFQIATGGFTGLGQGLAGFAVGFLPLFLLWMVGSAGGGDAKLMGAATVWLGFKYAIAVLLISTICVVLFNVAVGLWLISTHGFRKAKKEYFGDGSRRRGPDPVTGKLPRTMMTYATPIAVAVWLVVGWMHFKPEPRRPDAKKVEATQQTAPVKSDSTET